MTTGPRPPEQPSEPEQPPGGTAGGPPTQPPGQQPSGEAAGQEPAEPPGQPLAPQPGTPEGQPAPPAGYQQAPPPSGYYQPPPMRPDDEKLWAIAAHLGPLLLGFVAPLVVWLVFRDRSAFLDRHGKEALNFQIAYLVYFVVAGVSIVILVGFVLLPLVGIAWVVFMILASVKASQYQDYRYPAIFRVVS
ncbi:MAG TPA: DUF4870 domain-containing protein [Nocardioidaceae bacterium]|nr:DUF4870 domain-containing protein [Nocardioidaceae bacterium]